MSDQPLSGSAPPPAPPGQAAPQAPRRRRRLRTLLRAVGILLCVTILVPLLLLVGILLWADTDAGRRWVAGQIAAATAGGSSRVLIGDIDPGLPGNFVLRDVTVSDEAGMWMSLARAELRWSPWRLLLAELRIDSIAAQDIDVARLPESEPSEDTGSIWTSLDPERLLPDLPVELIVQDIDLRNLSLAEPVVGEAAVLDIHGRIALDPGSSGRMSLDLQRIDGTPGHFVAEIAIDRSDGVDRLQLEAQLQEPPGGLVAALAGWPGTEPVSLEATGAGPLTALHGRIAFSFGALAQLEGSYRAEGEAVDGPLAIGVELQGDVTGILPPDLKPLAGGRLGLSFDASLAGSRDALEVKSLVLATPAVALQAKAAFDAGADRIEAELLLDRLEAAALQPFLPGLELAEPHLALRAAGALSQPQLGLELRAARIGLEGTVVEALALQAGAQPKGPLQAGPLPRIALELQGRAGTLRMTGMEAAAPLLEQGLELQLAGELDPAAEALDLAQMRLALQGLVLQAQGRLAADAPLALHAVLDAPDPAPLGALLGMATSGENLHAELRIADLEPAALEALLAGLDAPADGPSGPAAEEGGLRPQLGLQLRADRLAVPEMALQGLAVEAEIAPLAAPQQGALPQLSIAATARAEAIETAAVEPEAAELLQPGLSLQLSATADPQARALDVKEAQLALQGMSLQAQGRLAAEGETGLKAVLQAADAARLAPLLGLPLSGSDLQADLDLAGRDLLAAEPGPWQAGLELRLAEPGYEGLELRPLLGGELRLSAAASGIGFDVIELPVLGLQGEKVSGQGSGRVDLGQEQLDIDLRLDLPDLSALAPIAGIEMTGRGTLDLDIGGPLDGPRLQADLAIAGATLAGTPVARAQLAARLDSGAEPLRIELEGSGQAMDLPLRLRAAVTLQEDGATEIGGLDADIAGLRATGGLLLAADGGMRGRVALDAPDLAPLGRGFGLALAGAARGEVALEPRPGGQGVVAELRLDGLAETGMGLKAAAGRLQADLVLADAGPRGSFGIVLETLTAGAAAFDRLALEGEGSLASGMQVRLDGKGRMEAGGEVRALAVAAQAVVEGMPPDLALRLPGLRLALGDTALEQTGTALVAMKGGTTRLESLQLTAGGGTLAADAAMGPGAVTARVRAAGLPLALAGLFVTELPATGSADLLADIDLRPGRADGLVRLDLSEVRSTRDDMRGLPASTLQAELRLAEGQLTGKADWTAFGGGPGHFRLALPVRTPRGQLVPELEPQARLDGRLDWDGNLDQVELFLPGVDTEIDGQFRADLTIAGTLEAPVVLGSVTVSNGSYRNYTTGTIVNGIEARVDGGEHGLLTITGQATDGDTGRLALNGRVELAADPLPTFTVELHATDFTAARLDLAIATISADLTASGTPVRNQVAGQVTVDSLQVNIGGGLPASATVIPVTVIPAPGEPPLNPPQPKQPARPSRTRLDIAISIPPHMVVEGRGLDSTWTGQLQVGGTTANPAITGRIVPVRGSFNLVGRRFQLEDGAITFSGGTPPNPTISLVFTYYGQQASASVEVSGTASEPQIRLTSNPPMPEGDIVSAVLFNRRSSQLSPAEALEVATSLAALTGRSNPSADLMGKVRGALGLDVLSVGSDASGAPTLDAGSYISDQVYVGVKQGLKADSSSVAVKVDLTDNIQIETEVGVDSNVGINWKYDY